MGKKHEVLSSTSVSFSLLLSCEIWDVFDIVLQMKQSQKEKVTYIHNHLCH